MVDYYYHNRDEGSLFFRVATPGQEEEEDEVCVLEVFLDSPGYTFHKSAGEEDEAEVSAQPGWTRELSLGVDTTFVLYYSQREQQQQRRRIKREYRRMTMRWTLTHQWRQADDLYQRIWNGLISSRIYPRREDVVVHLLDYAACELVREE